MNLGQFVACTGNGSPCVYGMTGRIVLGQFTHCHGNGPPGTGQLAIVFKATITSMVRADLVITSRVREEGAIVAGT